jgi:hypothetical protein
MSVEGSGSVGGALVDVLVDVSGSQPVTAVHKLQILPPTVTAKHTPLLFAPPPYYTTSTTNNLVKYKKCKGFPLVCVITHKAKTASCTFL